MLPHRRLRLLLVSVLVVLLAVWPVQAAEPPFWLHKVAPELLLPAATSQEVLVILEEQANLQGVELLHTKEEKGAFVVERLTEVAHRTQEPLRRYLDANAIPYRSFWIVNMLRVQVDFDQLMQVAQFDDVARVEVDSRLELAPLQGDAAPMTPHAALAVEWNVARVGAERVWADGITGQGAVVGSMDTGFEWMHPALQRQYRGFDRGIADHNYNWHDAIHSDTGPCGADSPEPCDADGHGTLTMGTTVGDDGNFNQIGVAPGARWIGCRCWEPVRRTHVSYVTECFEWFAAPTDLHAANADPARAPDVINNSWICEYNEGCKDPLVLQQVVQNVRDAGIVVVASAGNDGELGCDTIMSPPAIYDAAFTVGSTDMGDDLSPFSSRGPVSVDGSNRLKPDIVAPGQNVRSSTLGGSYESGVSGTSLAGPVVVGTVALMISAVPSLAGDVDAIEQILVDSAVRKTTTGDCGGIPNGVVPNNSFGWGRVDAWAAVQLAKARQTGIEDEYQEEEATTVVHGFRLYPARPNPFNPATVLRYDVPRSTRVSLHLYDVAGRLVRVLVAAAVRDAGQYEISWDGRDEAGRGVASGVYYARLEASGRVLANRRLTLVR